MYSQRNVFEWVETFKYGRTNVSDEARSGLPSVSRIQDHVERANVLIQEDGRITVSEVAEMLDIRQIEICNSQQQKTAFQKCSLAPVQFSPPMVRPQ